MIWLTGDLHFDHFNLWEAMRKDIFPSVQEMNQVLWDNLFTKLSRRDTLIFLGDLAMRDEPVIKSFFERIIRDRINLIFVKGNHDGNYVLKWLRYFNIPWHDIYDMRINNQKLTCCHYPMISWRASHRGSYQAYAHIHGDFCPIGKMWDCGVDNTNFQPVSWPEFVEIMALMPVTRR